MDYLDEGDNCPNCKGKNSLIYVPDGECSCNHPPYNPPCWPCTNSLVQCSECNWKVGDECFETGENMSIVQIVNKMSQLSHTRETLQDSIEDLTSRRTVALINIGESYFNIDVDEALKILNNDLYNIGHEINKLNKIISSVDVLLGEMSEA